MPKASAYLKGIAPKANLHDLDSMMWSCTPYPFAHACLRRMRRSLRKYFRLGGNSVSGAVNYAHDKLSYDFDQYARREQPELADHHSAVAHPKAYPRRMPPSHLPTRQYSRKLNRALKFKDVAEFSNLLSNPPPGLEHGWWVDDIMHQLANAKGPEDRLEAVQVKMFSGMLNSGLPISEGVFSVVLENKNYPLLRLLITRGMIPKEGDAFFLNREVVWQLMSGHWPYPEMWCQDALNVCVYLNCFDRLFPSERCPAPKGFNTEHIMRMSTLSVNKEFEEKLSVFYAELASKNDFVLLSTSNNYLVLGLLVDLGWINEKIVLSKAKPERHASILDMLHRAKQERQHDELLRKIAMPTLSLPLNRL